MSWGHLFAGAKVVVVGQKTKFFGKKEWKDGYFDDESLLNCCYFCNFHGFFCCFASVFCNFASVFLTEIFYVRLSPIHAGTFRK